MQESDNHLVSKDTKSTSHQLPHTFMNNLEDEIKILKENLRHVTEKNVHVIRYNEIILAQIGEYKRHQIKVCCGQCGERFSDNGYLKSHLHAFHKYSTTITGIITLYNGSQYDFNMTNLTLFVELFDGTTISVPVPSYLLPANTAVKLRDITTEAIEGDGIRFDGKFPVGQILNIAVRNELGLNLEWIRIIL